MYDLLMLYIKIHLLTVTREDHVHCCDNDGVMSSYHHREVRPNEEHNKGDAISYSVGA